MSQPARAVWIEIGASQGYIIQGCSHSLRGLCGLKYHAMDAPTGPRTSQPARAVWIEIQGLGVEPAWSMGHSLRGLCGLKFL